MLVELVSSGRLRWPDALHALLTTRRAVSWLMHGCAVAGGGGGAGYVGGAGGSGTDPANPFGGTAAGAGTSFLDASVPGTCQGLAGNSGNGYVNVYLFL